MDASATPDSPAVVAAGSASEPGADPAAERSAAGAAASVPPPPPAAEEAAAAPVVSAVSACTVANEQGAEAVQHFNLADDDEESMSTRPRDLGSFLADDDFSSQSASKWRTPASSSSHSPSAIGAGFPADSASPAEGRPESAGDNGSAASPTDVAGQIRERFKFLCSRDQQTVCRRECEVAKQREEALVKQIQQTIEQFQYAVKVSSVVEGTIAEEERGLLFGSGQESAPRSVMSPDLVAKYEERIRLLQGFLAALGAEPTPSMPKLTALEQAKGAVFAGYAQTASVAFAGYAQTASVASRLGAQASSTTTSGASGARAALSAFASRVRSGAGGGYSGSGGGGGPSP